MGCCQSSSKSGQVKPAPYSQSDDQVKGPAPSSQSDEHPSTANKGDTVIYPEDGGFEVLAHKIVTTSAQLKGKVTRRTANEVCIKPEGSQPEVWVVIEGAKDLRNADWFSKSDPYCVCEINAKEAAAKVKTSVVPDNLNPQWDYEAKITDYEIGDSLVFSVYDSDIGKDDDFLGKATLEKDQICKEGFHGPLELFDSKGRKEKGTLTVRVVLHNSVPTPVVEEVMTKENQQWWNQFW